MYTSVLWLGEYLDRVYLDGVYLDGLYVVRLTTVRFLLITFRPSRDSSNVLAYLLPLPSVVDASTDTLSREIESKKISARIKSGRERNDPTLNLPYFFFAF